MKKRCTKNTTKYRRD